MKKIKYYLLILIAFSDMFLSLKAQNQCSVIGNQSGPLGSGGSEQTDPAPA